LQIELVIGDWRLDWRLVIADSMAILPFNRQSSIESSIGDSIANLQSPIAN